jgi:hypothetical protein
MQKAGARASYLVAIAMKSSLSSPAGVGKVDPPASQPAKLAFFYENFVPRTARNCLIHST